MDVETIIMQINADQDDYNNLLRMFESGLPEWVIAENLGEAIELYKAHWIEFGMDLADLGDDLDPDNWTEFPLDKMFTYYGEGWDEEPVKKTAKEWCTERGKGWFATSEF